VSLALFVICCILTPFNLYRTLSFAMDGEPSLAVLSALVTAAMLVVMYLLAPSKDESWL